MIICCLWTVDTGPGRLLSVEGELGEACDEWAKKMMEKGVILNGLLPNSTSVSAIMDELFRAFKIKTRKATQKVWAQKIKANAKSVAAKKTAIAQRIARGETVSPRERSKVNTVATLDPSDLGKILYGKLDENGYGAPNSPIVESFTKEKIEGAHEKVCARYLSFYLSSSTLHHPLISLTFRTLTFLHIIISLHQLGFFPFTRKLLKNPKVRHEVGQGEETDQTRMMQELRDEYEQLKETVYGQGMICESPSFFHLFNHSPALCII